MIRGRRKRREYLTNICKEELIKLDQRIESGEVLDAVMKLNMSRSKL